MKLAVVIPTYNERENSLLLRLAIKSVLSEPFLLIFVDDSSPDGTADALNSLNDPQLILITRAGKQGIGSAYQEGFRRALSEGAELIVQMDADLSHDPSELTDLLAAAQSADLVIGSRYVKGGRVIGWGPWRHFCSRSAMLFARAFLGLQARDVTSGYRVWKASILKMVLNGTIASSGYAFQEEMLFRAQQSGAHIVEVPITFKDRERGNSKLGLRDVVEFFRVMIWLRKQR